MKVLGRGYDAGVFNGDGIEVVVTLEKVVVVVIVTAVILVVVLSGCSLHQVTKGFST